jgi:bleomycin hydrolase
MVIVGVKEYADGRRYWKVENSWGSEAGQNGFYIMNEGYLELYASEFIVNKKYLSKEQLKELSREPIILPCNDPLGA